MKKIILQYYNNLVALFITVHNTDLTVFKKIKIVLTVLICSNRITSTIFGIPVLFLIVLFRRSDTFYKWLFSSSLIHFPIRIISDSQFINIRKKHSDVYRFIKKNNLFFSKNDRDCLEKNGFLKVECTVPIKLINAISDELWNSLGYSAQVPAQGLPGRVFELSKTARFVSHDMAEVSVQMCAKRLLNCYPIKQALNELTGVDISLYSINFYWGFPQRTALDSVQKFHRDYDGYNCWVIFFALTDVDEFDGATIIKARNGKINYLTAKAGDIYIVDPFFVHSANPNIIKTRLTCWIRLGELPNLAYYQDLNFSDNRVKILKELNLETQDCLKNSF